jgi:signal transduction histidine kinase
MFLEQILALLINPPGNLIYHTILAFSIAGALQAAIQLMRSSDFPQAKRTVIGLVILLGLQLVMFTVSGLAWQGIADPGLLLPPLDRAVTLLTIVWLIWLWAFPEPVRLVDAASILLTLLAFTFFGLTYAYRLNNAPSSFNLSLFELGWQGLSLLMTLLGLVTLFIRKPNGWGSGFAMLLLALCGHLVSLIWRIDGNYPGAVRLMQLAYFPILLTLSQRFATPLKAKPRQTPARTDSPVQQERRRYSTDPKTFHALMSLAAEADANRIGASLTRGIAQAMLADLCFLIIINERKELVIACGYDLIREESLSGTTLDKEGIPLLANALQHGKPIRLPASSTSADLKAVGQVLGLSNPGHLLSVPIMGQDRNPLGGLLILSPYSNRLWAAEDQSFLTNVSSLVVPILERGRNATLLEMEREKSGQVLEEARARENATLKELEELRQKSGQSKQQAASMAALLAMQDESKKLVEKLQRENEELRNAALTSSAATVAAAQAAHAGSEGANPLEGQLRDALEELARKQNALADANYRILELEQQRPPSLMTNDQVEVVASISQELRQPMSSIIGYTDLLLGESVGILGTLQRKFIERIKSSTERIGGLVEDLIQLTNLDTGNMQFKSEPIDLNLIIDSAMAYTSSQIREKNITMRLDLPEAQTRFQTDKDAFQQVLIHLLQNATAASQAEGTITLHIRMENDGNEHHYISVQVSDTGGGIASEDIPRVFSRRYRAEHSLIQGLGDTGVGLSIAKALVEAQNGRIWVETQPGMGSTFSVLIPVTLEQVGEQAGQD